MATYISEPMSKAEMVVPMIANVKMAPKLRKKYFCTPNFEAKKKKTKKNTRLDDLYILKLR